LGKSSLRIKERVMDNGLLRGFRALDLTDEKGFACGKILASLGVDIIKIEKPGGDPTRNIPPFYQDIPDPEKSLYWFAFNGDKQSITLNLETSQGHDLFLKLVKKSDFVLESFPPGYMNRLGLGYEALSQVNPRIIMTSITPFGQKAPYSHYKSCELVIAAMSGVLETTGDPDRPPVKESPNSVYFPANAAAALGTVISHYNREISGEGQQVDVSIHECAASRNINSLLSWIFDKRLIKRSGAINMLGRIRSRWIWPCQDGYIYWYLLGGKIGASSNRALSQWIDEDGIENPLGQVTNWDEFDRATFTEEMNDAFEEAIGKFFLKHTKKEIAEEGRKRGINAAVVNNPADVLENQHLAARDYWADLDYPELGITLAHPRHFFLCNGTENYVRRRAPLIGEDNDEIYGKELGLSNSEIAALKETNII
jgi:crotonobetainyl-CoA:carnitine CoA-transferase CaiB-like acyl-CoA transferase